MNALSLPPLLTALATAGADPFTAAVEEARAGCDAGLVTYDIQHDKLRAAMVFAPEVALREAAIMLPVCGVGFQNALGALAPPEVAVHLEWAGPIRVNGAVCGGLRLAAEPPDPEAIPDWLVVALDLVLWDSAEDTGLTPEATTLFNEGCADVDAALLLEAWARHTLVWLDRWLDEGPRALYTEWKGLAHGIDQEMTLGAATGRFIGIDDNFGILLRDKDKTQMIPLTDILTEAP